MMTPPASILRKSPYAELTGLSCFAAAVLVRLGIDSVLLPPFITFYPAVFVATLLSGLRAGVICTATSTIAAWYFWVPERRSFHFIDSVSAASVVLFVTGCALVLYLARSRDLAAKELARERDKSFILFQELQHRVANNLMFVSSVIDIQRRSLLPSESAASLILSDTAKRMAALGQIHRELYDPQVENKPIKIFLERLCRRLCELADQTKITVTVSGSDALVDFSRAIPMALIVNEAVTNSIKYAFPDGQAGEIYINFEQQDRLFCLTIEDNGVGMGDAENTSGIGRRILGALATQLDAELRVASSERGTKVTVQFEA